MKEHWGVRAPHGRVFSPPQGALESPWTPDCTIAGISNELGFTGCEETKPGFVANESRELVFRLVRPTCKHFHDLILDISPAAVAGRVSGLGGASEEPFPAAKFKGQQLLGGPVEGCGMCAAKGGPRCHRRRGSRSRSAPVGGRLTRGKDPRFS